MVLGGIVSVQLGAALAATMFDRVGASGMVTLRLVGGALVLGLLVRPRWRGLSRSDLTVAVAFGAALAGMNASFYEALARMPLGAAVTVEFIGPLGLAVLLSRRWRDVAWVLLAAAGIVLLGWASLEGLDPVGVAFALAAGLCWAGYILLSAATGRRFAGLDGLAVASAAAALLVLPLGVASAGARLLEPEILLIGLGVALLSSVLPYGLELTALRTLPARTFGVMLSLEPVAAALAGLLVLAQTLTPGQLVAVALVVVASAGAARFATRA